MAIDLTRYSGRDNAATIALAKEQVMKRLDTFHATRTWLRVEMELQRLGNAGQGDVFYGLQGTPMQAHIIHNLHTGQATAYDSRGDEIGRVVPYAQTTTGPSPSWVTARKRKV